MYIRRFAVAAAALTSAVSITAGWGAGPAAASSPALMPFHTPIPVTACGALSVPGSYALATNIGPVPGGCLIVTAPDVTLDLAGHAITGMGVGTGILIKATADGTKIVSTLPGGEVGGFAVGIRDNSSVTVISGPDLVVADNHADGVWLFHTKSSIVEHVNVQGSADYGIRVQLSGGAVAQFNQVTKVTVYGIWLETSTGAQVVGNNVIGSGTAGVYLGCSGTANLQNTTCGRPTDESMVAKNTMNSNGGYGIAIADASIGNTIEGNQVSGDKVNDLYDENFHCHWPTGSNFWQGNSGTPNQTVTATCIG
jgi:parallel beta-helix repeat protein